MENKKVIVISGCKDCPYNINRVGKPFCGHLDHSLPYAAIEDSEFIDSRCKLNDLPEIHDLEIDAAAFKYSDSIAMSIGIKEDIVTDFKAGANYILNKINGS